MTTIDPILPMKTEVRNTDAVANALTKGVSNLKPSLGLKALLATDSVKARFESVLKAKSAGFMSSLLSLHSSNPSLAQCAPMAVIQAAAVAASLDLPINPSLGFAYIVPYKNKGVMEPQFQIGAKGFVQLAIRSGQYQTMNVTEVYEGEIETTNRITGEFVFNATGKTSDKVVGYAAYLKLLNGFEKYLYMTTEQAEAHG